jgi:hypothetical protein
MTEEQNLNSIILPTDKSNDIELTMVESLINFVKDNSTYIYITSIISFFLILFYFIFKYYKKSNSKVDKLDKCKVDKDKVDKDKIDKDRLDKLDRLEDQADQTDQKNHISKDKHFCIVDEYPNLESISLITVNKPGDKNPTSEKYGKLYISDLYTAKCNNIIKKYNIKCVINVCTDQYEVIADKNLKINISDEITQNISKYFAESYKFIDDNISNGNNVLVHCHAGISRSVTIVISYIMKKYSLPYFPAMKIVKSCRSFAEPNDGFVEQLKAFEKTLNLPT